MHTFKTGMTFFLLVYCMSPLAPLLILVERVATVAAWEVTKSASYFIIAHILVSFLLAPVDTILAT